MPAIDSYLPGFINLSHYRLEKALLDAQWDAFIERSAQGTLFSQSPFLSALLTPVDVWYCLKGQEICAAVALPVHEETHACGKSDYMIYNGIVYAPVSHDQKVPKMHSERFAITAFLINELAKRYSNIDITTSFDNPDLRPFLWYNYGTDNPKFSIDIRYTSLLSLPEASSFLNTDSMFFNAFGTLRKRSIRSSIAKGLVTREQSHVALFLEIYEQTFDRQNIPLTDGRLQQLKTIIESLIASKKARMFFTYALDGAVASGAVFGIDSKRAYYLYGANAAVSRDSHAGSLIFWHAMQALAEEGVREIDLEGINSPRRGYFKLSFGGSVTPYYRLRLQL